MSDKTTSSGVGFTSLLLIAFIVLKLCNVIAWSWFWVLSPFWIPCAIVLLLLGTIGVIRFFEARKNKKVVTKTGQLKSKWEQRLEEMQIARNKADALRNQKALDEKMTKNKGDEFRSQNIV